MTREQQIYKAGLNYFKTIALHAAFVRGANWADKHPKDPWISVNDKLPPFGEEVYVYSIFYSRFGEWKTKRYKNHVDEYGYKTQEDEYGFDTRKAPYYSPNMQITHWRPIPLFPKQVDL